jgi:hypothetical protein
MSSRTDYTCGNDECEHEFEVRFYPETPDRFMSGRFEDAEQGSAAECDPCECPKCGTEVDVEIVSRDFEE